MTWVRKIILGLVVLGMGVQVAGYCFAPPEHAIAVIILGIGLVCAGAAGLAGKEAHCLGWREGWWAAWLYAALILFNLLFRESVVINSLGFSALFLLLLSLAGRKLRQPLLAACPAKG